MLDFPEATVTDDDPTQPDDDLPATGNLAGDSSMTTEDFFKAFNLTPPDKAQQTGETQQDEEQDEDEDTQPTTQQATEPTTQQAPETQDAPPGEPAPAEPKPEPAAEPTITMTQAQFDATYAQRLARDRKFNEVQELEALEGKPLAEVIAERRDAKRVELADRTGLSEAEVKAILEDREKVRRLEAETARMRAQQAQLAAMTAYQNAKRAWMQKPGVGPLICRSESEFDAIAAQEAGWNAETAAHLFLMRKVLGGTLQQIEQIAKQQTIADVQRRQSAAIEPGKSAPSAVGGSLPSEVRFYADAFMGSVPGLTRRGVAKQLEDLKRRR